MTDRTLDRVVTGLLVALVALLACLLWAKGSRAQDTRPSPAVCLRYEGPAWPSTLWVDGRTVEAAPIWTGRDAVGRELRCWSVPAWAVGQYEARGRACNAYGCTDALLEDGSPAPAYGWSTAACRADLNDDGVVGGADFLRLSWAFASLGSCVPGTLACRPDLTGDGAVGGADFARWSGLFQSPCP